MSKYYAEIRGLELNAEEILKYCSEWPRSFLRLLWEAIALEGSKKKEKILDQCIMHIWLHLLVVRIALQDP